MAKTSIFSSKYHKRQKRKKLFQRTALFLLVAAALFLLFRTPITNMVERVRQNIKEEEKQREEILEQIPTPVETPAEEEEPEEPLLPEPVYLTVTLPGGEMFSIEVVEENGEKLFKPLDGTLPMEADLSPSRKKLVALESTTQDLYLVDTEGAVTDITYRTYKNTRGYTASKESILERLPDFDWASQPKFLDEDTVVYMSQLPWFDERRFLYIVELDPLSHRNFQRVGGEEVVLLERVENGLKFSIKGVEEVLTPDYKVVNP